MDTVVNSLLSSDIFLIETPLYTGAMSANEINFVSEQFTKILGNVKADKIYTNSIDFETLSANKLSVYYTNTVTTTGNFNTYTVQKGLITSAYNTYTSELSNLSSFINYELSSLSAAVFNVFFDSGTALLINYVRSSFIAGSITQTVSGTKAVPSGLDIRAQDINYNIMFTTNIDNIVFNDPISIFQITSAYPVAHIGDFDFELDDLSGGELDDYGNNYVNNNGNVEFKMYIQNIPWNVNVVLQWSVLRVY